MHNPIWINFEISHDATTCSGLEFPTAGGNHVSGARFVRPVPVGGPVTIFVQSMMRCCSPPLQRRVVLLSYASGSGRAFNLEPRHRFVRSLNRKDEPKI